MFRRCGVNVCALVDLILERPVKIKGWYHSQVGDAVVVSRLWPVRFDISAQTVLRVRNPLRLAHQVRQDVWRALRHLRGFAPAVQISKEGFVLTGGRLGFSATQTEVERLEDVLNNIKNQTRWARCAGGLV